MSYTPSPIVPLQYGKDEGRRSLDADGLFTKEQSSRVNITFVTSIIHIYEEDYDVNRSIQWRIERFKELVALGINICIYVSPEFEPFIRQIESENPDTVKIMRILNCEDTMIANMLRENCPDYKMPKKRNSSKDNEKYSIVINSKTEFMTDTVERNPWNTTHFAWIDFNISYVFKQKESSLQFIKWMAKQTYIRPECFVIAGCEPWFAFNNINITDITESIYWRFCGGFFLADAKSIWKFHELYLKYFPWFLREYRKLIWEVNFWAWLETNTDWQIHCYPADHNDSIICNIPLDIFAPDSCSSSIVYVEGCNQFVHILDKLGLEKIQYDYPSIENQFDSPHYFPSSAAYLETSDGRHLLNTRYVNYWYQQNGSYTFFAEPPNYIRNLNFCSELTSDFIPKNFTKMEETIDIPFHDHYSRGIEDLRLYEYNGKIRYIATTVSYYHTKGNRMIVGDYVVDSSTSAAHYENSRIVESPEGNYLEKNWAPLIVNCPESRFHSRELFVYKWSPFTIGELRENPEDPNGHLILDIIQQYDTSNTPIFKKMKGSTQFIDTGEYLVGVVHFTEDASPRKYFHMLVSLDRTTMRPLQYSEPFCFEKVSIEFCIGFKIENANADADEKSGPMSPMSPMSYIFWISRMDREPLMVKIGVDKIPICIDFL